MSLRRRLCSRAPRPPRVAFPGKGVAFAFALALGLSACDQGPRSTIYDLAADAAVAQWLWPGDARVIASPLTEIDYREKSGGVTEAARTIGSALDIRLFAVWPRPSPREAALCLEGGAAAVAVDVALNRTSLATIPLRSGRHTYRLGLPEAAQHGGVNRLRLTFQPAEGTTEPEGAPFGGALVAPAADPAVGALVASDLPPFERAGSSEAFTLRQWAPGTLRYALRVPERAELRLGVRSLPAAAAGARYRVTVEPQGGVEREVLGGRLEPGGAVAERSISLPGPAGSFAWVSLHAEPGTDGLARVEWTAPRVVGAPPPPPPTADVEEVKALRSRLAGASVLLLVLDAARAREFSTYGYDRPTTLEIDRLGREGVVFEQAHTPATYTISAMSSLWTSLYHEQHHHGANFRGALPGGIPTLAEILGAGGVKTTAFVSNPSAGRSFGLDRGFSEFHLLRGRDGRYAPRAGEMVDALAARLGELEGRRTFTYVHFLEPHFPYDQPDRFVTLFGPAGPLTPAERHSFGWITDVNRQRRPFTSEERANLVRLYDGNLAYVDAEVGRLRRLLEDSGLLDEMVVIVTADHGDELYERGQIGHGGRVYEEDLHIPLIVRFPRGAGPAGLRVKELVDLLDLAPTVLDVLGLTGAPGSEGFEGRSLLPVLYGQPGRPVSVGRTMHERPTYSFRDGPWKLIHSVRSGQVELYELDDDPGETRNLSAKEPVRAEFYRQTLYRWLRGLRKRRGVSTGALLSPEDEETLRALGYLN